ncbi:MAG TPA: hypothetical protein ENF52_06105 [Chloroflexi bacterium]|nr:hypothetical protein [Chloroflexota bacterium]
MERPTGQHTFDILILIGRPASGKSEIINFLLNIPYPIRRQRYHVANLDVLDDFPMLWAWFEEDHILEKRLGQPRLHTDEDGYFRFPYLWHVLIERISLEYSKRLRDNPFYHANTTCLIEFSRGSEHGGYQEAFSHLSNDILHRAGVVYVHVPFEESLRKNRRRFNPDRPDSILEHSLPDEKLTRLYRHDDWDSFSEGDPHYLHVRGEHVPYVVFPNDDDVTTDTPDRLASRLKAVLDRLWNLQQNGQDLTTEVAPHFIHLPRV